MVSNRDHPSVYLGAAAFVANVGVYRVCEVHGGGACRKDLEVALWRKHKNLLGEKVNLQGFKEFVGIGRVFLPLNQLPQPRETPIFLADDGFTFLVFPVRGYAVFRHPVHLLRPYLNLHPLSLFIHNRCVERLIEVGLWKRYIVFKPSRHRFPRGMYYAEDHIAVFHLRNYNPEREDIVDVLEFHILLLHFLKDAVKVLYPAAYIPFYPVLFNLCLKYLIHGQDIFFALGFFLAYPLLYPSVFFRLKGPERQVLKFHLNPSHPEPVRKRGIDIQGFLRYLFLPYRVEKIKGAHVMEPVGKLYKNHPYIVCHRKYHLPEVLGLAVLFFIKGYPAYLRKPVHKGGYLLSENLLNPGNGREGVFDRVVEKCSGDRGGIHFEVGKYRGNLNRVVQVWFP